MKKFTMFASLFLASAMMLTSFDAQADRKQDRGKQHSATAATVRPSTNGAQSRPTTGNRPSNNVNHNNNGNVKPGNVKPGNVKPGNVKPNTQTGNHHNGNVKPGNNNKPNGWGNVKPGNNGNHWGNNKPHDNGNHFGKYKYKNDWRPWMRPLPVRPPRPVVHVHAPRINSVLGLAFGSLINAGVNALIGAGYNVLGTAANTIYLGNVNRYGVIWPEATIFYGNNGMNGARFQYGSRTPGYNRWETAYAQLCSEYGAPVESSYSNGQRVVTWWGGYDTGYITLRYTTDYDAGYPVYYTDLIYGM